MISLSSNLVKQQRIVNVNEEIRVMNYNQMVADKLKHLSAEKEKCNDGFTPGIQAEEVQQVDPEDLIRNAEARAQQIISEAKSKAAQEMNEANSRVQQIIADNRRIGYEQGISQLNQEMEERREQLNLEFQQKQEELQTEYQEKLETMERDIVDAICQVFSKVFHIQFDKKQEMILHLVRNTVLGIDTEKNFRIRVSKENQQYLKEHMELLRENMPGEITLEILGDAEFDETKCIIETDSGVMDSSIDTELENLLKAMKSLC